MICLRNMAIRRNIVSDGNLVKNRPSRAVFICDAGMCGFLQLFPSPSPGSLFTTSGCSGPFEVTHFFLKSSFYRLLVTRNVK
jgi:hypothetical protein